VSVETRGLVSDVFPRGGLWTLLERLTLPALVLVSAVAVLDEDLVSREARNSLKVLSPS